MSVMYISGGCQVFYYYIISSYQETILRCTARRFTAAVVSSLTTTMLGSLARFLVAVSFARTHVVLVGARDGGEPQGQRERTATVPEPQRGSCGLVGHTQAAWRHPVCFIGTPTLEMARSGPSILQASCQTRTTLLPALWRQCIVRKEKGTGDLKQPYLCPRAYPCTYVLSLLARSSMQRHVSRNMACIG